MKLPSLNLRSFKNLFSKKAGKSELDYNAKRDWKMLLIFFTVIAFVLACFSGYLFYKINNGDIFTVEKVENSPVDVVNKKNLDETVDRFESKKAKLLELKEKKIFSVDPSI